MDQLQINEIIQRIDNSLGEELPFSAETLGQPDLDALHRVFGDVGFQAYLDDQANRQIIRVYLTNAVVLGYLPAQKLEAYTRHVESPERRAALSLHILMSSVEDADTLPLETAPGELKELVPGPDSPPNLQLIQN